MGKFNRVSWMEGAGFEDAAGRVGGPSAAWTPTADVLESDDGFVIVVELPGLTLDDITLEIKGNQIILFGRTPDEKRPGGTRHHVVERPTGPFARAFTLDRAVRAGDVAATLRHGLLTITLKKAAPRRRSIPVE
ncbi:MAG: Hsp20/alpha crystallin family protein [Pseudodesulfovibrio sp.]